MLRTGAVGTCTLEVMPPNNNSFLKWWRAVKRIYYHVYLKDLVVAKSVSMAWNKNGTIKKKQTGEILTNC